MVAKATFGGLEAQNRDFGAVLDVFGVKMGVLRPFWPSIQASDY